MAAAPSSLEKALVTISFLDRKETLEINHVTPEFLKAIFYLESAPKFARRSRDSVLVPLDRNILEHGESYSIEAGQQKQSLTLSSSEQHLRLFDSLRHEIDQALILSNVVYETRRDDCWSKLKETRSHCFSTIIPAVKGETAFVIAEDTSNNDVYIAFRGTQELKDWIDTNLHIKLMSSSSMQGKAHDGFLKATDRFPLISILESERFAGKRIVFCGHSLGGAIAAIATIQARILKREAPVIAITFGAPLFGDTLLQRFCEDEGYSKHIYHVVCENDPVPALLSQGFDIAELVNNTSVSQDVRKELAFWGRLGSGISEIILAIASKFAPTVTAGAETVYNAVKEFTNSNEVSPYVFIGNFLFLACKTQLCQGLRSDDFPTIREKLDHVTRKCLSVKVLAEGGHFLANYESSVRVWHGGKSPTIKQLKSANNPINVQLDKTAFQPRVERVELKTIRRPRGARSRLKLKLVGENLRSVVLKKSTFDVGFRIAWPEDNPSLGEPCEYPEFDPATNRLLDVWTIEEDLRETQPITILDQGCPMKVTTAFGSFDDFRLLPGNVAEMTLQDPKHLIAKADLAELIKMATQRCGVTLADNESSNYLKALILAVAHSCCKSSLSIELNEVVKKDLDVTTKKKNYKIIEQAIAQIVTCLRKEIKFDQRLFKGRTKAVEMFITRKRWREIIAKGGVFSHIKGFFHYWKRSDDAHYEDTLHVLVSTLHSKKCQHYNADNVDNVGNVNDIDEISQLIQEGQEHDRDKYPQAHIESMEAALEKLYDWNDGAGNFDNTDMDHYKQETKKMLVERVDLILNVRKIRKTLSKQCFIGIAGVQNSGKTTLVNKLFNKNLPTGLKKHTEKAEIIPVNSVVTVVDTPGTDSVKSNSKIFAKTGSMHNLIILIVPFSGDICQIMVDTLKLLKGTSSTRVLLCNNLCEEKYKTAMKPDEYGQQAFRGVLEKDYREKLKSALAPAPSPTRQQPSSLTRGSASTMSMTTWYVPPPLCDTTNAIAASAFHAPIPMLPTSAAIGQFAPQQEVQHRDLDGSGPSFSEVDGSPSSSYNEFLRHLEDTTILFTDWEMKPELRRETGIEGVDRIKREIREFLIEFNVYDEESVDLRDLFGQTT